MNLVSGYAEVDDVDEFVDSLAAIAVEYDCTVQAVDARYVAGKTHLTRALELADRAIARGEAIAHDRSVELLLYVAGTRQIDRAFEIGVSTGRTPVVVVVDSSPSQADKDTGSNPEDTAATAVESVLELAPFEAVSSDRDCIYEWFEIGEAERAATDASLQTLVCERVALLALES